MYVTAGTQFRLGKYLASVDTCCLCLSSSSAWLLGTASRIFLGRGGGCSFPAPEATGYRYLLVIPREGLWPRPWP